jgi:uncharacterized membrane protein
MKWLIIFFAVLLAIGLDADFGFHGLAITVLAIAMGVLLRDLHMRVRQLEDQVRSLGATASGILSPAPATSPTAQPRPPRSETAPEQQLSPPTGPAAAVPIAPVSPAAAKLPAPPMEQERGVEADERSPRVTGSVGQSVLAWFRGGNAIVRVGVVILFIGVAFLLRFAAEHAALPIELRLAAVAVGGLALVIVGWRLRTARPGYGMSLQGAGVGVLYLVIFAGLRLYGIVPAPLAFALLVALSMAAALLAVLQDAVALAVLGFGGGFLAPVAASTGHGSHIVLFSYYLALNIAIAWIASRRAWKLLNLVGFAFTFGIGTAWGLASYDTSIYLSTQAFLLAHFALYLFISIQYSRRLVSAADEARLAYVDGGLLFGLPLVTFSLQAGIVKHLPYGLAISAGALSGIYLLLGRWLWRSSSPNLRLLTEGMLALGLVFLVLVTPLALDARWTGTAWSVQGAGMLWIALRQRRGWAAAIGVLLQVAAAVAFWSHPREAGLAPWINAHLIGALALGLSAMFSAHLLAKSSSGATPPWPGATRSVPTRVFRVVHWTLLALGTIQILLGLWDEWAIADAPALDRVWRASIMCAIAGVLFEAVRGRLRWPELTVPARVLALLALAVSAAAVLDAFGQPRHLFDRLTSGWGWVELVVVLGAAAWMQRRLSRERAAPLRRAMAAEHLAIAWYAMLQAGFQGYGVVGQTIARHESWTALAVMLLPTLLAWWLAVRLRQTRWPADEYPLAWRRGLLIPWALLLALWTALANLLADGGMQPLPYVPLLNPIDLGQMLAVLYVLGLLRPGLAPAKPTGVGLALAGFAWLNGLLVRSLHHYAGTPMWLHGALASDIVQTGLTILWTSVALAAMLYATRRAPRSVARPAWIAGAALLALVVAKLFFVDLSSIGTLERIVSFLGVGLLMLVIGYVSPMPPAREARP